MTITLCMIVRNEEKNIERSLNSALPHVDSWCIIDTGSTDSTMQKILEITNTAKKPGQLHQRPWVNFGHNRTELLELARPLGDWCFMLDADDSLEILKYNKNGFAYENLDKSVDAYTLKHVILSMEHYRQAVFNSSSPWIYIGVIHESAHLNSLDKKPIYNHIHNITVITREEGYRSQNPNKYRDDALLLEVEIMKDPTNTRNLYYAANSWREAKESEKAEFWYKNAIENEGNINDIYYSYMNLVILTSDIEKKFQYSWKAHDLCPDKLEATYYLLVYLREHKIWNSQGYAIGLVTYESYNPKLIQVVTINPEIYNFRFYDEFSIYAHFTKHYMQAVMVGEKALKGCLHEEKQRIITNLEEFYKSFKLN